MIRVADLLKRESNIFDALRLFAATLVIYSHSYALTGIREPQIDNTTLGTLGVRIFFILSGLLVTASWASHPRTAAFIGKRLLRILPALFCVIAAAVFIIGPLFTTVGLGHYFSSNQTSDYFNGIYVFGLQFTLPGVFAHNPYPYVVNGSLWTLPYELLAYIILMLLGRSHLLKKGWLVGSAFIGCLILYFITLKWGNGQFLFTLDINAIMQFFTLFLSGVLLYIYRHKVILDWRGALIAVAIMVACFLTRGLVLVSFFTLPYLLLYVGSLTRTGLAKLGKYGDFSYGMYIYAWLVQQCIVELFHNKIGHNRLFVLSFAITLILAIASWHFVEKPMLQHKKQFSVEKYPLTEDAW